MARASEIHNINSNDIIFYIDKETLNHNEIIESIHAIQLNITNNINPDYHLINIYGSCGKGKTILKNKITNRLESEKIPFITFDCDNSMRPTTQNINTILLNLRNELVKKYNFNFPNFDLYIDIFSHPTQCYFSEYIPSTWKKNLITIGKNIVKTLGDTVTAGFTSSIFDDYEQIVSDNKKKNRAMKLHILNNKANMNLELFYKELIQSFIYDYNASIKKFNLFPMVIILDTFEDFPKFDVPKLFNHSSNTIGVCHSLDKTVWIISGQDKPNHLDYKNDWTEEYCTPFKLQNFTENDIKSYLKVRGLNPKISSHFFKTTLNGEPLLAFFLSEEILRGVVSLKEVMSNSSLKNNITDSLLHRYIKYLESEDKLEKNSNLSSRIKMLTALGSWTHIDQISWPNEIKELVSVNDNFIDFETKSLITKQLDENNKEYLSINKNFKNLILTGIYPREHPNYGQPIICDNLKVLALDYLSKKYSVDTNLPDKDLIQIIRLINSLTNLTPEEKWDKLVGEKGYLNEYIQHLKNIKNQTSLIEVYISILSNFDLSSINITLVLPILQKVLNLCYPDNLLRYYSNLLNLLDLLPEKLRYTELVAIFLLDISELPRARKLLMHLFNNNKLSLEGYKKYSHQLLKDSNFEQFELVINKYKSLIYEANNILDKNKIEHEKNIYLLYLSFFTTQSDANNANYYANLVEKVTSQNYQFSIEKARILGNFYKKFGYFKEAQQYFNQAVELIENKPNLSNKEYIYLSHIYNNLADIFYETEDLDNYKNLTLYALNIRERFLPSTHEDVIQSLNNYGTIKINTGEYSEAISIFNKVLQRNIHLYGEKHIKVALNKHNIGLCYYYMSEFEKAQYYLNESYKIKKKHFNNLKEKTTIKTLKAKLLNEINILTTKNYRKIIEELNDYINNASPIDSYWVLKTIETLTDFILDNYKNNDLSDHDAMYILQSSYEYTFRYLLSVSNKISINTNEIFNLLSKISPAQYVANERKKFENTTSTFKETVSSLFSIGKTLALESESNISYKLENDLQFRLKHLKTLDSTLEQLYGKL